MASDAPTLHHASCSAAAKNDEMRAHPCVLPIHLRRPQCITTGPSAQTTLLGKRSRWLLISAVNWDWAAVKGLILPRQICAPPSTMLDHCRKALAMHADGGWAICDFDLSTTSSCWAGQRKGGCLARPLSWINRSPSAKQTAQSLVATCISSTWEHQPDLESTLEQKHHHLATDLLRTAAVSSRNLFRESSRLLCDKLCLWPGRCLNV